MIGSYEANGLYDALSAIGEGAPMVERIACTVLGRDADGTVWVRVPGGPDRTPLTSITVEPVEGHTIYVEFDGTQAIGYGDETSPSVGETTVRKIMEPVKQSAREAGEKADSAKTAAEEAKAVAGAVGQHFFADENGVHVTEAEGDATTEHNILINSLGILLRKAANHLVSITQSAVAFYDGLGNAAGNIVAQFGADGSRIGKDDSGTHIELDRDSMEIVRVDSDSTRKPLFSAGVLERSRDVPVSVALSDADVMWDYTETEVIISGTIGDITAPDGTVIDRPFPTINELTGYTVTVMEYEYDDSTGMYDSNPTPVSASRIIYPEQFASHGISGDWPTTRSAPIAVSANYNILSRTYSIELYDLDDSPLCAVWVDSWARYVVIGLNADSTSIPVLIEGISGYVNYWFEDSRFVMEFGDGSESKGKSSVALGNGSLASSDSQAAVGRFNVEDANGTYAAIIGNGTDDDHRSNALGVKWDGTVDSGIAGVGANTWVQMLRGRAALYVPKDLTDSTTSNYAVGAVVLETAGGGAWAIANYNDESLKFVYISPSNRESGTNTVTQFSVPSTGILTQAYGGTGKNSLYKLITYTGTYATLNANAYTTVSLSTSATIPSGYSPVAFLKVDSGRDRASIARVGFNSSTLQATVVNGTSTGITSSSTVTVQVLYLPTAS